MDYNDFFRERLAALRICKGVSARDMSLSLGQSESYINKIENGRAFPSMEVFFYICEYFDVSPSDFFAEDLGPLVGARELTSRISRLDDETRCAIHTLIDKLSS